jgi:hypothetical protein
VVSGEELFACWWEVSTAFEVTEVSDNCCSVRAEKSPLFLQISLD